MNLVKSFRTSELILALAGFLILVSVLILSLTAEFTLLTIAKILYGLGVMFFVFDI